MQPPRCDEMAVTSSVTPPVPLEPLSRIVEQAKGQRPMASACPSPFTPPFLRQLLSDIDDAHFAACLTAWP
jgi:hypothetical protein